MEDSVTQERKTSPAVHRTLDQFEFRDVAFRGSIAFSPRQPGDHRSPVLLQAMSKALEFLDVAGSGLR